MKQNNYIFKDNYVIGETQRGTKFYFDIDDYNIVKQHFWILLHGVVATFIDGKKCLMHNLITGEHNLIHKNGNRLDNRKENLVPSRGFKEKITYNGYYAIYYPEHPRAYKNGCVYEHILVAEKILGRYLTEEECVHHIDRNRKNNDPNNLMIFKTNADHMRYHQGGEPIIQDDGTYISKLKNPVADKEIQDIINKTKDHNINKADKKKRINVIRRVACPYCGGEMVYTSKMCSNCYSVYLAKNIPPKEELEPLIYKLPFTTIAKQYGVTDNAVRKWCKKYGLPYRKEDIKHINYERKENNMS